MVANFSWAHEICIHIISIECVQFPTQVQRGWIIWLICQVVVLTSTSTCDPSKPLHTSLHDYWTDQHPVDWKIRGEIYLHPLFELTVITRKGASNNSREKKTESRGIRPFYPSSAALLLPRRCIRRVHDEQTQLQKKNLNEIRIDKVGSTPTDFLSVYTPHIVTSLMKCQTGFSEHYQSTYLDLFSSGFMYETLTPN